MIKTKGTVPKPGGRVVLYKAADGGPALDVRLDKETVWLSQRRMAELFGKDTDTVGLHIRNIFREGELKESATTEESSVVRDEGGRTVRRTVGIYNLDVIISVGYRVKSQRGTQFRIWATRVLREHLVRGYTVNARRLQELKQAVRLIANVAERRDLTGDEAKALLRVVADYSYALEVLDDYDHQRVRLGAVSRRKVSALSIGEARRAVETMRGQFGGSGLFGREKDQGLEGSLAAVMQTFGGADVYPSLEEKAANLLSGQEPPFRRWQQAHRRGAVPVVPGKEPRALPQRRNETHRRQRTCRYDTAHRREPGGGKGRTGSSGGDPDQQEKCVSRKEPWVTAIAFEP